VLGKLLFGEVQEFKGSEIVGHVDSVRGL